MTTFPTSRIDLLNRALTAAALVALAVTSGVWLTRSPLTAATPAPAEAEESPALAPLPLPAPAATTTEVQIELEIASPTTPVVADPPPAAKPAETKREPQNTYQPRRRSLFRRR
jgi:hypothetical protein